MWVEKKHLYLLGALLLTLCAFVLALAPGSARVARGYSLPPSVPTSTPACGLAWRQVSVPLPAGNSELDGVAGLSSSDVWAVGSYGNGTVTQTLTLHWDGTQWSIVPSPNVGANSRLSAIAAPVGHQPSNGIWAVGYSGVAGASQTLIMHWDGTQWSIVPSSNGGAGTNILDGVAFAGDNDLWAVGYYGSTPTYRNLSMHWYGTQWSIVPSPNDGTGDNLLLALTATAPGDVWAVGTHYQTNINLWRDTTMHWNGSSWTLFSTFPSYGNNYLFGVFAVASNDVWTVGGEEDMVEHWGGAGWGGSGPVVPGDLHGVSGSSRTDVWAVGDIFNSSYSPIYHYDGNFWFPYPANSGTYLRGVAAIARDAAWTVGFDGSGHALVEQYTNPCASPTSTAGPSNTPTPISTATFTSTPTPTSTPTLSSTSSPTATPTATLPPLPMVVGHVTWQGIGQPDPRNDGITATLSLCVGGNPLDFLVSTDASGFFTVTVDLSDGTYNWRYKGRKWFASSGTITLSGGTTQHEFGQQRGGDASNDNAVNAIDFSILKSSFGKASGIEGYDERSDFNNDNVVNGADFTLLRSNFGTSGAAPNCP